MAGLITNEKLLKLQTHGYMRHVCQSCIEDVYTEIFYNGKIMVESTYFDFMNSDDEYHNICKIKGETLIEISYYPSCGKIIKFKICGDTIPINPTYCGCYFDHTGRNDVPVEGDENFGPLRRNDNISPTLKKRNIARFNKAVINNKDLIVSRLNQYLPKYFIKLYFGSMLEPKPKNKKILDDEDYYP